MPSCRYSCPGQSEEIVPPWLGAPRGALSLRVARTGNGAAFRAFIRRSNPPRFTGVSTCWRALLPWVSHSARRSTLLALSPVVAGLLAESLIPGSGLIRPSCLLPSDTSKASGARAGCPVGSSKSMILGKQALLVSGLVLLDSSIGPQQAHGRLLFSVSALTGHLSPGPGRGLFLAIRAPRLGDEDLSTPGRVTPSWGWHRGS